MDLLPRQPVAGPLHLRIGLLRKKVRDPWQAWCFLGTMLTAAVLGLVVLLAPWLASAEAVSWGGRVLFLFADDVSVRRATLIAAVGLAVTACVFFRGSFESAKTKKRKPPPIVGA